MGLAFAMVIYTEVEVSHLHWYFMLSGIASCAFRVFLDQCGAGKERKRWARGRRTKKMPPVFWVNREPRSTCVFAIELPCKPWRYTVLYKGVTRINDWHSGRELGILTFLVGIKNCDLFRVAVIAFTSRGNRRVRSGSRSPDGMNVRHIKKPSCTNLTSLLFYSIVQKSQNLNKKKSCPRKKKKN